MNEGNNLIVNVDENIYNSVSNEYYKILKKLEESKLLINDEDLTWNLKTYFNSENSLVKKLIQELDLCKTGFENVKNKVNIALNEYKKFDEEMYWQVDSIVDELFTSETVSDESLANLTCEDKIQVLNEFIYGLENTLDELNSAYKELCGTGIPMGREQANEMLILFSSLGLFQTGEQSTVFTNNYVEVRQEDIYNPLSETFDFKQLAAMVECLKSTDVVSCIKSYCYGESWEESGLAELCDPSLESAYAYKRQMGLELIDDGDIDLTGNGELIYLRNLFYNIYVSDLSIDEASLFYGVYCNYFKENKNSSVNDCFMYGSSDNFNESDIENFNKYKDNHSGDYSSEMDKGYEALEEIWYYFGIDAGNYYTTVGDIDSNVSVEEMARNFAKLYNCHSNVFETIEQVENIYDEKMAQCGYEDKGLFVLETDIGLIAKELYYYRQYVKLVPFEDDLENEIYLTKYATKTKEDYKNYKNNSLPKEWLEYLDTTTELALFDYLYNEVSEEEAQKYLDAMEDIVNQRKGAKAAEEFVLLLNKEYSVPDEYYWLVNITGDPCSRAFAAFLKLLNDYGLFDTAVDTSISTVKGFIDGNVNFVDGLVDLVASDGVKSSRDYEIEYIMYYLSTNSEYTENLSDSERQWLSYSYQFGSSIGNMFIPSLLSYVPLVGSALSTTLLFASSTGNSVEDLRQQGVDSKRAYLYGAVMGLSEVAIERIFGWIPGSADDMLKSGATSFVSKAYDFAGDLLGEAGEEVVQTYMSAGIESMATGEPVDLSALSGETLEVALMAMVSTTGMKANGSILVKLGDVVVEISPSKYDNYYDFKSGIEADFLKEHPKLASALGINSDTNVERLDISKEQFNNLDINQKELISNLTYNSDTGMYQLTLINGQTLNVDNLDKVNTGLLSKYFNYRLDLSKLTFNNLDASYIGLISEVNFNSATGIYVVTLDNGKSFNTNNLDNLTNDYLLMQRTGIELNYGPDTPRQEIPDSDLYYGADDGAWVGNWNDNEAEIVGNIQNLIRASVPGISSFGKTYFMDGQVMFLINFAGKEHGLDAYDATNCTITVDLNNYDINDIINQVKEAVGYGTTNAGDNFGVVNLTGPTQTTVDGTTGVSSKPTLPSQKENSPVFVRPKVDSRVEQATGLKDAYIQGDGLFYKDSSGNYSIISLTDPANVELRNKLVAAGILTVTSDAGTLSSGKSWTDGLKNLTGTISDRLNKFKETSLGEVELDYGPDTPRQEIPDSDLYYGADDGAWVGNWNDNEAEIVGNIQNLIRASVPGISSFGKTYFMDGQVMFLINFAGKEHGLDAYDATNCTITVDLNNYDINDIINQVKEAVGYGTTNAGDNFGVVNLTGPTQTTVDGTTGVSSKPTLPSQKENSPVFVRPKVDSRVEQATGLKDAYIQGDGLFYKDSSGNYSIISLTDPANVELRNKLVAAGILTVTSDAGTLSSGKSWTDGLKNLTGTISDRLNKFKETSLGEVELDYGPDTPRQEIPDSDLTNQTSVETNVDNNGYVEQDSYITSDDSSIDFAIETNQNDKENNYDYSKFETTNNEPLLEYVKNGIDQSSLSPYTIKAETKDDGTSSVKEYAAGLINSQGRQEIRKCFDVIEKYFPGMSNVNKMHLIYMANSGACTVATSGNMILDYMYTNGGIEQYQNVLDYQILNEDGSVKSMELLVDLYCNLETCKIKTNADGQVVSKSPFINVEYDSNTGKYNYTLNEANIKNATGSYNHSRADKSSIRVPMINQYFQTHGIDAKAINVSSSDLSNTVMPGFTRLPLIDRIKYCLDNDLYVDLVVANGTAFHLDEKIANEQAKGNNTVIIGGSHSIQVVGITEDGNIVVKTWGGLAYLNSNEITGSYINIYKIESTNPIDNVDTMVN